MSTSNSIKIVGQSTKVVDHDGLTIEEFIGNVSTHQDDLSLGIVTITKPTSEPWITLHYDEWIHVTEGYIELHQQEMSRDEDGGDITTTVIKVNAGETVFIPKGSRMQPVFPVPSKYLPTCLPAFKPERCIREEGTELSDVSTKLAKLHRGSSTSEELFDDDTNKASTLSAEEVNAKFNHVKTIYHMCQTSQYEKTIAANAAYFPPTFVQDGRFTHATHVPSTLLTTANHFYKSTHGDWICLELDREVLESKYGIVTIFECAKSVGNIDTGDEWKDDVYPHVFGGLPLNMEGVLTNVYKMSRDEEDGTFLSIDGLV